jgi:hypothetical protein
VAPQSVLVDDDWFALTAQKDEEKIGSTGKPETGAFLVTKNENWSNETQRWKTLERLYFADFAKEARSFNGLWQLKLSDRLNILPQKRHF